MDKPKKSYYEKLPRKVRNGIQCQVLEDWGNRCKGVAAWEIYVHLDGELYSGTDRVGWVSSYVCEQHKKSPVD